MALNLLRFVAWQHLLLVPLVVAGVRAARRGDGMVAALAAGPALMIVITCVLLPYQGHGWGLSLSARVHRQPVFSSPDMAGRCWRQSGRRDGCWRGAVR
jgi:hypothetical protein